MKNPVRSLIALIVLIFALSPVFVSGQATGKPYNESQDIRADLKKAAAEAKASKKHVLVQFGGNWCPWCLRFHNMVHGAARIDSLMKADYVYVLANVPQDKKKRDYDLFRDYGYPNRFGYPVFVILDGDGKPLHIQDSGILEHCTEKGYDTTRVISFLKMWTVKAVDPATYPKP